jgi:methionyl-tRNA formyltransferase
MRIAFVGLPLAALLLHADGHEIVWAGICRRGAIGTRRLRARLGARAVAIVPDLAKRVDEVRALEPDLVVSWFWTKKVPRAFRETARVGAFGVHPSLLPRHRGPDPYFWAIDAGDEETGVTAHELEDEYDTGALLGTKRLGIDPSWNAWTLAKRLDRPSLALLREITAAYARGERPRAIPQDESRATEAPAPTDEELELRWTDDAAAVVRRVRAASPWPGAFTEIAGEVVTLTRARATSDVPRAIGPGEAVVRPDGIAVVRARDAGVELLAGRVAPEEAGEDEDEIELDAAGLAALVRKASAT